MASNIVMNDQSAVDTDHALEVKRRHSRDEGVAHRLGVRLAEDEHLLNAAFELLVSPAELVLSSFERGDRRLEALKVRRLVGETVGRGFVDNIAVLAAMIASE